jgi:hypothetical protein
MPYLPDLDRTLTAGLRVEAGDIGYVIESHDIGMVVLPTGRVVGCDPLVSRDQPFTEAVPPGTYPLRAWVAILDRDGVESQRRIAALQLIVSDAPTAAWTMALTAGQDLTELGDDEFFGYGVDAGTGYPTYIGHTADGQVTSFVTDFDVLPAPDDV